MNLLGPITQGASFFIVQYYESKPYVVNTHITGSGDVRYYLEHNFANVVNPPVFTAVRENSRFTFSDSTNGGGLAYRTDNITLGNAFRPVGMTATHKYADWNDPNILLTNNTYTLKAKNEHDGDARFYLKTSGEDTRSASIEFLPALFYVDCTADGSYDYPPSPAVTLANWFCAYDKNSAACADAPTMLYRSGWANLDECILGVAYDYCLKGKMCGDSNCNGPCKSKIDACQYTDSKYSCKFNTEPIRFLLSPWYFAAIGVLIVMGMMLLIIKHAREVN